MQIESKRLVDVAKLAGVSVNTASRVLNKRGYISQTTKQKVEDAIKELNYKPNEYARNLLKKKSDIIALLMPSIEYHFYSKVISAIETNLQKRGYKLLLCNSEYNPKEETKVLLDMVQRYRFDGLIIFNHELKAKEYNNIALPMVSIDRYVRSDVSFVSSDHSKGGRMVAQFLAERGCKYLLQISGLQDKTTPWNERHSVFSQTMQEYGIECKTYSLDVHEYSLDFEGQKEIIKKLLLENPKTDGFFSSDLWAVSALKTAHKLGICVPDELQIVGYDGTIYTEITTPEITVVQQDAKAIGRSAADIISKMISENNTNAYNELHDVKLIERGSTKKLSTNC